MILVVVSAPVMPTTEQIAPTALVAMASVVMSHRVFSVLMRY